MATNKTELCNLALSRIGQTIIQDYNSESEVNAIKARLIYPNALDEVLSAHPWNSCVMMKNIGLPTDTKPAMQWSYQYEIPSGSGDYCLRVLQLNDGDSYWEQQGRKILTDDSTVVLKYIFRNEDVRQYSPYLVKAITAKLAYEFGAALNLDERRVQALSQESQYYLKRGAFLDSQEGIEPTIYVASPAQLVRHQGAPNAISYTN